MDGKQAHISIVIVNYKVKEYVANLLSSVTKAVRSLNCEIFVVDNNSGDDSVTFLKARFPDVQYIENDENLGFGRANNQAINLASGKYILIINPDTLVSEDTLSTLFRHMEENPECGAAGCKILNPDGTFAPESRRSVPTIWTAATKLLGLGALFPKSKLFGRYYLSWLGEDEPSQVPVLSGSFMFWRASVLKELGGFDERFFMYGEDIDLCYRIRNTGYHIDYVPQTSIIHYKGESTRKGDLKYIRIFNKALYQFYEKHYSSKYSRFFQFFIFLVLALKTVFSFVMSRLKTAGILLADLLLLNSSVAVGYLIRYGIKGENILNKEGAALLWINLLATVLYLFSGAFLGLFREKRDSLSAALKALVITYSGVVFITFFVRDLAYSRLGLIIGFAAGMVLFIGFKLLKTNRFSREQHGRGKVKAHKVMIVGDETAAGRIIEKINSRPDWNYEVLGYIDTGEPDKNNSQRLGHISQFKDLVSAYDANQIFFALRSVSYKKMLALISGQQHQNLTYKVIPESMDFILGKSNIEYLESIPLVEVDLAYFNPVNGFLKRAIDLIISVPVFLLLLLFAGPATVRKRDKRLQVKEFSFYAPVMQHKWKNRLRLAGCVASGKLSLVGASLVSEDNRNTARAKPGLTGPVQVNRNRIRSQEDAENFELYYLQNYSVWTDLDILIKTIFNGPGPLNLLSEYEKKQAGE